MPLRLAFDSKSPKIIETALSALQQLIAHGLLRGDADSLPEPSTPEKATEADDETLPTAASRGDLLKAPGAPQSDEVRRRRRLTSG